MQVGGHVTGGTSAAVDEALPAGQSDAGAPAEPLESAVDSGLHCLVMLAAFYQKPANLDQIRHARGKAGVPFDDTDILISAKELGLKARAMKSAWDRLSQAIRLPVIARRKDGTYFILAKMKEDRSEILIHDPLVGKPEAKSRAEIEEAWDGSLLLVTSRAALAGGDRRFDVSWFIPAIVKYRRMFAEVLIASAFIQVLGLISPLFFMVIIDKVLTHRGLTSLDVLIFALVVVSVFEVLLGGLRTYLFSHTTNRIDVQLGAKLFKHLLSLPISYFGVRRVGETVARVRELENIRNFLTGSGLTLIVDLGFTLIFFAVMFKFSLALTLVVLVSIPVYVAFSLVITPILQSRIEEKFRRSSENQSFLVESVTGIETLKASATEPQAQRKWEEQLAAYVNISFKTANIGNIASQGVQFIQKITMAFTLYIGARLVIDGHLSIGELVAFNMLSGRVAQPILKLAQLWNDFQQARLSIARLGDILNEKTENTASASRAALPTLKGAIKFDQVVFRYRPNTPEILKRVSLDVPAGQVIGIVGRSGSGKSTLTKLVQRLYLPESGRIFVDGTDLSMVDPAWLRRQVGVVLQENFLFNRSVRDNIALADPSIPMERVIQAAEISGAHEFILGLAEGYDTLIEERGSSLSGGQRQRIAIARALVTNPRILILDEATSALDYESEQIIQSNMRRICAGRTVFIIAHRLSTVRDCDRIITVETGEIVEDGTHAELLAQDGRYAFLWKCQVEGMPMDAPASDSPSSHVPHVVKSAPEGQPLARIKPIKRPAAE